MQVRREQCSGGAYFDHFTCPLCNKFVINMQVHDGGYNQPFCQRPFCGPCLIELYQVKEKQFIGAVTKRSFRCPVVGCTPPLQPPMIRAPDASELKMYRELLITCDSCLKGMNPYEYRDHKTSCPGKPIGELILRDIRGPFLNKTHAETDNLLSKNLFLAGNGTFNLTGKATYARYFVTPMRLIFGAVFANRETRVQVSSDVDHHWMLNEMRRTYGFAASLDLVNIEVTELAYNGKVDEFLADIDVGAPLNVCRASQWDSGQARIKFCYIQGVERENCKSGAEVFSIKEKDE